MRMLGCYFRAAQLAALHIPLAPDKLAKRPKCGLVIRLAFAHDSILKLVFAGSAGFANSAFIAFNRRHRQHRRETF
jgi:hypothetical protein